MASILVVRVVPLSLNCNFVTFANMAEGVIVIGATNFPEMLDKFVSAFSSHTLTLIPSFCQGARSTRPLRQTSSGALA
jgi:hypothetical protein